MYFDDTLSASISSAKRLSDEFFCSKVCSSHEPEVFVVVCFCLSNISIPSFVEGIWESYIILQRELMQCAHGCVHACVIPVVVHVLRVW